MTFDYSPTRLAAGLLCGTVLLAGCTTSGVVPAAGGGGTGGEETGEETGGGDETGGSGGDSATAAEFDTEFKAAMGLGPTTTPLSGTASHTGEMMLATSDGTDRNGEVIGDLTLQIDFDDGAAPVTATAENFSGNVGGNDVTLTGQLSSEGTTNMDSNEILTTPLPAMAGGGESTSFIVGMEGTLVEDGSGVSNALEGNLNGQFYGADGAATAGAAGMAVTPTGGTSVLTGSDVRGPVGGQFYTNKN